MQNFNKKLLSLKSFFRTITLFLLLFTVNQSTVIAQCNTGAGACLFAEQIDFPFSTQMISVNNNSGPIPGCNGNGIFHNTTWYQIIPLTTTIEIAITSSNCSGGAGGNEGIQLGLYPDCDPNSVPIGDIQCDCAAPGATISLGTEPGGVELVIGQPYYITVSYTHLTLPTILLV